MNEREIVEAIAGMNSKTTVEEMDRVFKAARELYKPEQDYSKWIGAVVEVRDYDDGEWKPAVLSGYETGDSFPVRTAAGWWKQWRPYREPLKLIFTPHQPGDPCPVSDDEVVIVKRRDGRVMFREEACSLSWVSNPAYPHLELVGYVRIAL